MNDRESNERGLHERASALFLEVRDLTPPQRAERLQTASKNDHPLIHEVQSLLEHDQTFNGGHAPRGAASDDVTTDRPAFTASSGSHGVRGSSRQTLNLPERIGPYRVIERIGRGGSGFVLLAEQTEPVRRRVAIKIVPYAALDPDFAARFEIERRALERTDHPNIARILDAGRTADGAGGLPYLVMEYVDGVSITEHCRRRRTPLRERIELMLNVADAVQHAHQRGVIHRDLKPGNILVSEHTEGAQADRLQPVCRPHVLDFGIAKPIIQAGGASSEWAGEWAGEWSGANAPPTLNHALGTPAYMAPEQTGGTAHHIDTRADVYALGAVMYELACRLPPNDIGDGDPVETLRRIREIPPPPASRVRAEHSAEFAGDHVPRSMLNDLDCALARALEKEPDRRYATVAAFADDLKRILRREPIEARKPTLRYRAARFTQRNRTLVAAMFIVVCAIALGVIGLVAGLAQAKRQKLEATNQTEAQREINRFLTEDLLAAASPDVEGQNTTALELLHRASAQVDARFVTRPFIAASIHHTLGVAYTALGSFDDADLHLKRAIELRRVAAGPNAPDTIRSEIAAASLLGHREKLDEAGDALTVAITRARLILGENDPALYAAINDLGTIREAQDRAADAIELLQEALEHRTRLLGPRDPLVLATLSNLSQAYDRAGDTQKSLKMLQEALRIAESLPDPPRMTLLELNNNVGATFQDLNLNDEAAPYLRKAAELARDFLGEEHPATLTILSNLAGLEAELGNIEQATNALTHLIEVRTRILGPEAFDTLTTRYAYCNAQWHGKQFDNASNNYLKLLPDAEKSLGETHWFTTQTRAALALALMNANRIEEARPHVEKAVAQFTALYGPEHPRTKNAAATLVRINRSLISAEVPTE